MSMRSVLSLVAVLTAQVLSGCAGGSLAAEANDDRERLLGAWVAGADEKRFTAAGRGTYFRAGIPCFMFSFALEGQSLTETPDGPNRCGAIAGTSRIAYVDGNLVQEQASGDAMTWRRAVDHPPVPRVGDARYGIETITPEGNGFFIRFHKDTDKTVDIIRSGYVVHTYVVTGGVARLVGGKKDGSDEGHGIFVNADDISFGNGDGGRKLLVFTRIRQSERTPHLCWIERVWQTENGIALSFAASASLRLFAGADAPGPTFVSGGLVRGPDGVVASSVILRNGQRLSVSKLVEDNCTITAVAEGERKGVLAQASLHLPGLPGQSVERFIPAEDD